MINEIELKNAGKFYNLKYKLIDSDTIIITHNGDDWLINYDSKTKEYILYHKNLSRNKTYKCQYHHQRNFRDIWYMFRYIKEHRRGYNRYKKMYRINELLQEIEKNNA